MRMQVGLRIALLLALSMGAAHPSLAAKELVLAKWAGPPLANADGTGFLDQLMKALFARLGIAARLVKLPAERALINANEGIEDGDALRVKGLEALYPNLLRVPEKILDMEFVVFSKKIGNIPINGWDSLKPYVIGIVRGWKVLEKNLADAKALTIVNSPEQLFTLLRNDRADIVVFERWQGMSLAAKMGLKVRILEPPVAAREMFIYLNKKHRALVGQVAAALKEMKRDGRYDQIMDRALAPLGARP